MRQIMEEPMRKAGVRLAGEIWRTIMRELDGQGNTSSSFYLARYRMGQEQFSYLPLPFLLDALGGPRGA